MIKKLAAAALTGGLVLGAGTLAWAETGSSPSTTNGTTPNGPRARAGRRAGIGRPGALLRRAEHGDLTVRTKDGFETVTLDRGTVTAVSATSITVQRPDGQSVTEAIDASTRFRGV